VHLKLVQRIASGSGLVTGHRVWGAADALGCGMLMDTFFGTWGVLENARKDACNGPDSLSKTIVAPVDTFVRELVAWATQHRDADLTALETAVRDGLRALAPQLVGGLISVTQRSLDPGLRRDHRRCPACGALGPA
jgi:hypothetical protein